MPALYEPYVNGSLSAVDEWTLSENMRSDTANGGIQQLVNHYETFIVSTDALAIIALYSRTAFKTEEDFAQIAGAGLNWVRIPLPYWAIETWSDEPFLAKTCWT